MSARAASSALILTLLLVPTAFRSAQAGPWLPAPGEYYAELRGSLFSAEDYHNADGDRVALGGKWEERSLRALVELGWKKHLSFVMSAPFVSATQRYETGDRTSTGLEDMQIGLRCGLHQGRSALAAELGWQGPLGYDRGSSVFGDPLRDGGLEQLSLMLSCGTPIAKRGFLQLGAGGGYRFLSLTGKGKHVTDPADPEGPVIDEAKERWGVPVQASADLGLWLSRNLLVGGRYAGTITASHGNLYPERTVHLAGPVLLYRVDDRLDLMAGSWSTAMAENALHYDQVYVSVAFKSTKLNRAQGFLGGLKTP
jgi:hypothetical protein